MYGTNCSDWPSSAAPATQLYVCTTCRLLPDPAEPKSGRAGARLHAELERAGPDPAKIRIVAVECLSVCRRACTVAFAAAGKWTYVVGDFHPELAAAEILASAAQFAEAPDGIIPWKSRSEALKRNVVARIPPLALPRSASLSSRENGFAAAERP